MRRGRVAVGLTLPPSGVMVSQMERWGNGSNRDNDDLRAGTLFPDGDFGAIFNKDNGVDVLLWCY